MANPVPDGVYSIQLPFGGGSITDAGEGRYLNLLDPGTLGPDAHKIKAYYKDDKGAYSLQFEKSGKYLTWADETLHMNTKLVVGDKPRYFKIAKHQFEEDKFSISAADDKQYHVGLALERIYPPWVALLNFPEKQPWAFNKV
ncbi:hypothetical protein FRC09_001140 [Ceratobasidium sp. 395]|nr:hypothetical protein FRC09_001140 [Ceratobasidium sp. 395]